jgi:hypothetical protein
MDALIEEYGKTDYFGWMNENERLSVSASDFPVGQGKPRVSAIVITLGAEEDSAKKDI